CFTDAGWTISSSGYTPDKIMGGDSSDSIRMSKDGKSITVYIYNKSGNALALRDCPIGGISDIEVGSGVSVELAKGITASSSVDDIISAFGTPSSRNDYSDYTSLTYQQNDSNENKIQFYCYKSTISKKYSSVSVKNFVVTEGDKTTTDPIAPPYLDTYNTPSVLGSDITSATISVGGDLYNLAAPVSEFVRNGWTIIEQPYFVAAGKTGEVTVSRNGTKLTLYITNFGYYQTTALNCAVHAVAVQTDDNIAMKLPGGIGIGSTKSAVQAAVTDDFRYYDGSSTEMWTYSDTKSDITIEITVDKSTSKVSRIRVFHEIWQ
ncbi:MAG: hypothetical protein IKY44_02580, partial [Clostridia bacterium]|nr:hypothetical protein [Clostridia bacterium]